jgi:hypothetical protein
MKAQVIQAFRWIAVLPGAIIAFAIAQILVLLGGLFTPDFFVQLAGAWACPICLRDCRRLYRTEVQIRRRARSYSLNGSNDVRNDILGAVHRAYSRRR